MVRFLPAFCAVLCLLAGLCSPRRSAADASREGYVRETVTITHDSLKRTAIIARPRTESAPLPLLLVLHGGMMNPANTEQMTGFTPLAESNRFIVVYPAGIGQHWNDGRQVAHYRAMQEQVDDVGFLTALVRSLIDRRLVDPDRLAVVGPSNGAMMTMRLLCESPLHFGVAVPVIAPLPAPLRDSCRISGRTRIHLVAGEADPLVPYAGGTLNVRRRTAGTVIGFEETASLFAAQSGCGDRPVVTQLPDRVPGDGTTVTRRRWEQCSSGGSVELLTIAGGGHRWPGVRALRPLERALGGMLGTRSEELDLSELVVDWMKEDTQHGAVFPHSSASARAAK